MTPEERAREIVDVRLATGRIYLRVAGFVTVVESDVCHAMEFGIQWDSRDIEAVATKACDEIAAAIREAEERGRLEAIEDSEVRAEDADESYCFRLDELDVLKARISRLEKSRARWRAKSEASDKRRAELESALSCLVQQIHPPGHTGQHAVSPSAIAFAEKILRSNRGTSRPERNTCECGRPLIGKPRMCGSPHCYVAPTD